MDKVFLTVLKMSIISSYVILFVLLIRLFLKKLPKIFSYVLWGIVLFRLICPISIESKISFIPKNSNIIATNSINVDNVAIGNNYNISNNVNSNNINSSTSNNNSVISIEKNNASKMTVISIASNLWVLAILTMISYNFYSLIKLKGRLKASKYIGDNIYESEYIETAFVMGIIKPRIYIPINLSESEKKYILLHEKIHIKRYDNIIKVVSYLALIIHWFNPLVWIAFILMSKDMEMSCDEAVVKILGSGVKKEYSMSLLAFASDRKMLAVTPIAFGEGDVKSRIKNVLKYKKPRFWITIISIIVLIIISLGLMFNPIKADDSLLDINETLEEISNYSGVIISEIGEGAYIWSGSNFVENIRKEIDGWSEYKIESSYELSADIVVYINGNRDYKLSFYESEPNLIALTYNGKIKYYKPSNLSQDDEESTPYEVISLIKNLSGYYVPEEVVEVITGGRKTNKTSYEDRPLGVDYLELDIYEWKYYIYEENNKYYVERPYLDIYEIEREDYEGAKKYFKEPEKYIENNIDEADIEELVCKTVAEQESGFKSEDIFIVAPKIFVFFEEENKLKIFTTVNISSYSLKDNIVELESGGIVPYAITYSKNNNGEYSLEEFLPSMDGSYWESSIREFCTMPVSGEKIDGLADKIINHYADYSDIIQLEREKLIQYLEENNLRGISLLERGYNEADKIIPLTD